jgi:hypothetical protein
MYIDNLYELKFTNYHAVDFYNWLGEATTIGLKRKWQKIDEFINLQTQRKSDPLNIRS